jgi:hypothetical protein
MQQSTSFDLDSIRFDSIGIRDDGRRRNITINGVEDGHRREEGGGRHNNYFEAQVSNIGSLVVQMPLELSLM